MGGDRVDCLGRILFEIGGFTTNLAPQSSAKGLVMDPVFTLSRKKTLPYYILMLIDRHSRQPYFNRILS